MATTYKIHPAIGIARVGNSPDEFFIGPERIGEHPNPAGGFKDNQCRVKRQAARFRIFAHHDDNSVEEITDLEAEIEWSVHLVNKKAANPERNNTESDSDLTIDPGQQNIDGPNQIQPFDSGQIQFSGASAETVYLGEIRSDNDNHLIVLGGRGLSRSPLDTDLGEIFNNADWYDDVSDGPITARIKLRSTNIEHDVAGAWVIVGPPKFAPHIDNVITLYDRIYQALAAASPALLPTPSTTSYTKDIFPILQRARDTKWVHYVRRGHGEAYPEMWIDPVMADAYRNAIFDRLKGSGADMPALFDGGLDSNQDGDLTSIQYAHMQRWHINDINDFTNDWIEPPDAQIDITPDGLDRAALEHCVGGAFYPGIETGGFAKNGIPIIEPANYSEAFRLNHTSLGPGDLSYSMALPWQADFSACGENWWPVPRPTWVHHQDGSGTSEWTGSGGNSSRSMVQNWHKLGFVVQQGDRQVEVDRCDVASITLITPHLNFLDIPQGPMGIEREHALAISFEVISPTNEVTLEFAAGAGPSHSQLVAFNSSVTVGPTNTGQVLTAQLWIVFRTDAIGSIPLQTVTVVEVDGTQEWDITISGNTVARKIAAATLVLDRSGSMSDDRGDGQSKHASLQQAANIFIDLMLEGDGIGLVRYNQDAQVIQQVLQLGNGALSDINRSNAKDLINGSSLNPQGATSIGDGIFEASAILNNTTTPYDIKSQIILTDGKENNSLFIADVSAQINEQTYAIGLGTPQNTSVPALQTISGNNGGYVLVTGEIDQDNRFKLQKYFLQILAGISKAEVVLDPDGELIPGQVQRIPFNLTEADTGVDVILLTPYTKIVDFRLQTPNGLIIEPWRAIEEPAMQYISSDGVSYYRLALPAHLVTGRPAQAGTWHALIKIGSQQYKATPDSEDGVDREILLRQPARKSTNSISSFLKKEGIKFSDEALNRIDSETLPYSLIVHSYSSISLAAGVNQTSYEPGTRVSLHASITEFGISMERGSAIWAEVTRPNGTTTSLVFKQQKNDLFAADFETTVAGVYHFRVRASGKSRKGHPLNREQVITVVVWHGGNRDAGLSSSPEMNGGCCKRRLRNNVCFNWLNRWLFFFCRRKHHKDA